MPLIDLQSQPSRSMLRWFGLSLALFLALIGFLIRNWSQELAICLFVGAVLLGLVYYLIPQWQSVIIRGWQYLTFPIAFVVGHLLLGLTFYCVFWPMGLILKARGYDPLSLKDSDSRDSQWSQRSTKTDAARYFKQF